MVRPVKIAGGEVMEINFTMKAGSVELQEVEIIGRKETTYQNEVSFVASKTATALRDVPQAVSYVTKEVSLKSRVSGRVISGVGDRRR